MKLTFRRAGRPFHSQSRTFFSVLVVLGIVASMTSCRRETVPAGAFKEISTSLGSQGEEVDSVRIYLDVSASMRGFALAATRNEAGASAPFQSLLTALDSVADETVNHAAPAVKPTTTAKSTDAKPGAPRMEVYRFGSLIEPLPAGTSLVSAPLGRSKVRPTGGREMETDWLSKDCSAKWGGSAEARADLDRFYSETSTCLNQVFEDAAKDDPKKMAFIIITDAEQLAPEGSERCPAARSAGTIQERLDDWIRVKHRYAAVVAFRLGYLPWESKAAGKRYCGCTERLLFAYLLTPGPESAEKTYALLARTWKGSPEAISYLPLAPRPASQFDVEVTLPYEGSKKPALFPTVYPKSLQEPQLSGLPVFPIELKEEKATVQVQVKKAGFERSETRSSPGFSQLDWAKARFTWREVTTRFAFEKGGKKKAGFIPLESAGGGVEILLQGESPKESEKSTRRTGRFQGRATVFPASQTSDQLPGAAFVVRRAPGRHGSDAFLIELTADSTPLVQDLWKDSPFIGKSPGDCIRLTSLREQVQLAGRTSPVVRFLLHVDY